MAVVAARASDRKKPPVRRPVVTLPADTQAALNKLAASWRVSRVEAARKAITMAQELEQCWEERRCAVCGTAAPLVRLNVGPFLVGVCLDCAKGILSVGG
jgi:hypothetical protein